MRAASATAISERTKYCKFTRFRKAGNLTCAVYVKFREVSEPSSWNQRVLFPPTVSISFTFMGRYVKGVVEERRKLLSQHYKPRSNGRNIDLHVKHRSIDGRNILGVVGSMYFFPPYRFKAFKVIIMILAALLQASVAVVLYFLEFQLPPFLSHPKRYYYFFKKLDANVANISYSFQITFWYQNAIFSCYFIHI